jgi:large subunit ribosomal protein L19
MKEEVVVNKILESFKKKDLPEIRPGDLVRISMKIKDKDKEKIQIFEGVVIAKKHRKEIGATITVRREISGIGVEKIFPLHSPLIEKIEILKRQKVRRAKLYYLRRKRK